jgi:hypothetical protein
MAFQVSPGVNVSEIDLTNIIPAVSTSIGASVGSFTWGPTETPTLISSEEQLVSIFGEPKSGYNQESFFTAANFLSYSNALYVTRVQGATSNNAADSSSDIQIGSRQVYDASAAAITGDTFIAKYPGTRGNNLAVSVCPSTAAYNSTVTLNSEDSDGSTATVTVTMDGTAISAVTVTDGGKGYDDANDVTFTIASADTNNVVSDATLTATVVDGVITAVTVSGGGEYTGGDVTGITVSAPTATTAVANATFALGSNVVTVQYYDQDNIGNTAPLDTVLGKFANNDYAKVEGNLYKITGIGSASALSSNTDVVTATFNIDRNFKGTATSVVTSIERYWEFFNLVDRTPQNSKFASDNGSSVVDEVHVVVYDSTGDLTGSKRTAIEVFEGLSRATNAKAEDGTDTNLTSAINNRSAWLWRGGTAVTNATEAAVGSVAASAATLPVTYDLSNGTDSANEDSFVIGEYGSAWDKFKATDVYDVSLMVAGKATAALANYIIDNIVTVRKDCMVFVSPEKSDVVSSNQPIAGSTAVTNVVGFRNSLNSTSYASMDSGYKYQYDKYNDAYVWVPLNGDVAGLCARTDSERDPWFSPAGFARGNVKNVVKLAFGPTKAERDELYKADVNPVVSFPGQGTVLYGDKTLQGYASAFDRINVRRLFITLEKSISTAANALLFEFNDAITRAQFRNAVVPFLREVQGRRGITDFSVIADETNNTAEVVDQNQFVGDIYIKPARSINFIQLNFVAVRSGVEFSEVVGAA